MGPEPAVWRSVNTVPMFDLPVIEKTEIDGPDDCRKKVTPITSSGTLTVRFTLMTKASPGLIETDMGSPLVSEMPRVTAAFKDGSNKESVRMMKVVSFIDSDLIGLVVN